MTELSCSRGARYWSTPKKNPNNYREMKRKLELHSIISPNPELSLARSLSPSLSLPSIQFPICKKTLDSQFLLSFLIRSTSGSPKTPKPRQISSYLQNFVSFSAKSIEKARILLSDFPLASGRVRFFHHISPNFRFFFLNFLFDVFLVRLLGLSG